MKNETGCLTFCILLASVTAWGQKQETNVSADTPSVMSDTRVDLQRRISMERDSKSEEVILNIDDDVDSFDLIINSSVTAGVLKIEVYDPKGNNQGTFSVGRQLNAQKSEQVNGKINKALKDPQSGNWKVNIVPTETTGTVIIQTALFYH